MEDNYMSTLGDNEADLELLDKCKDLEKENETLKKEIIDQKTQLLAQKHQIEDAQIENDNFIETIKNLQGLIEYYKQNRNEGDENENAENSEKFRNMELKLVKLKDKIKDLEDSLSVKNTKFDQISEELKQQNELNEKLVSVITNKDEEIKNLKEKKGKNIQTENLNLPENVEELKKYIIDLKEQSESLKNDYESKIKELTDENDDIKLKLRDAENNISELKEDNEKLGKKNIDDDLDINSVPAEIESLKKALNEMKQSKQKLKERAEKQRDLDLHEIQELSRNIRELKYNIKDLEEDKNRNEYNLQNNEIIIANYKSKLTQKNMEIENLNSKCKEFKDNLDQDEKDRDDLMERFKKQKENYENQIKDVTKKLDVTLRELNDLRMASGKEEISVDQMMEDPKQKLADEIENKNKEIEDLKKNVDNLNKDKSELDAQIKFMKSSIETLNKNIADLKAQKGKAGQDFSKEMENLQIQLGNYKCQLAMKEYDTDKEIIKYKTYIKKLQSKLEAMGFRFRRKTVQAPMMVKGFKRTTTTSGNAE